MCGNFLYTSSRLVYIYANPENNAETVNPFLPSSPCLPDDRNSILV